MCGGSPTMTRKTARGLSAILASPVTAVGPTG